MYEGDLILYRARTGTRSAAGPKFDTQCPSRLASGSRAGRQFWRGPTKSIVVCDSAQVLKKKKKVGFGFEEFAAVD